MWESKPWTNPQMISALLNNQNRTRGLKPCRLYDDDDNDDADDDDKHIFTYVLRTYKHP
jgi:hypothetical protein